MTLDVVAAAEVDVEIVGVVEVVAAVEFVAAVAV